MNPGWTRLFQCITFVFAFLLTALTFGKTVIVYPMPESASDSRYQYDWTVLRTALEKTRHRFGSYDMVHSAESMSAARVTTELSTPSGRVNILVRATSRDLEQRFLPIRIPVDRGLLGYRLFLVRASDLPRFAAVHTLDDLRRFRVGQGKGWTDVAILSAAGFSVEEGTSYEGLFPMLVAGRFDFFSRAIDEALREYDERHANLPELAVEPNLLLYYPLPRYFFVRRDAEGKQLAARIEAGLEMMIRDGSLEALFQRDKWPLLERAALHKRRILSIPNPTLSPETPLSRRELWYDPFGPRPSGSATSR